MRYADGSARIVEYRRQIASIRQKMCETQLAVEPREIAGYEFRTPEGSIRLSELFDARHGHGVHRAPSGRLE